MLIEIPLFDTQERHAPMHSSMNEHKRFNDFLWLQSPIISYWSTSCTANCLRTCVITAPDSTFTTSVRIQQPWHPGISRFSDIAWPEAWSILHQKRYRIKNIFKTILSINIGVYQDLTISLCNYTIRLREPVKSQLTLMFVGMTDMLSVLVFHIYRQK